MLYTRLALTALSTSSSVISFAAYTLFLRGFGAGPDADQLFFFLSFPMAIAGLLSGVLLYVLPAHLVRLAQDVQGVLIGAIVRCALAVTAIAAVGAMLGVGCDAKVGYLVASSAVFAGLLLVSSVLSCLAQARGQYLLAAMPALLIAIGLTFGAVVAIKQSQTGYLVGGQVIGAAVAIIYLSNGMRLKFRVPPSTGGRHFLTSFSGSPGDLMAIAWGTMAFTLFPALDAVLAARVGDGALTVMAYTQKVMVAVGTLISMGAYFFAARIAHAAVQSDGRAAVLPLARKEMLQSLVLGFSVWIAYVLGGHLALEALLGSSRLRAEDLDSLLRCIQWMLLGAGPMAAMPFLFRIFYSLESFRPPATVSFLVVTVYLVLAFVQLESDGVYAMAKAYAITWWIALPVTWYLLVKAVRSGASGGS